MKKGEEEAKIILEKYGAIFDNTYQDDNVGKSKPDLQFVDGRYLEVTHTNHNEGRYRTLSKYDIKPFDEKVNISNKAAEAFNRVINGKYDKGDICGIGLSESGEKQFAADCKLVREHWGYDPTSYSNQYSEFKCDAPSIHYEAENILHEIFNDKGKKYPDGNVDLFIFVVKDELELFLNIFKELNWNLWAVNNYRALLNSPFPTIYLCVWDLFRLQYDTEDPTLYKFEIDDEKINVTAMNISKDYSDKW